MKVEPTYAENIVVCVKYKGNWEWYVTKKDFWFLDLIKDGNDIMRYKYRFGIPIVNEYTVDKFLGYLSDFKVDCIELKMGLLEQIKSCNNDLLDYLPSLLVDFDAKCLYSLYPEPVPFERYVPEGWTGEYRDFLNQIPNEKVYWIIDDVDYFHPE